VVKETEKNKLSEEFGGVVAAFGRKRLNEALDRAHEFVQGPLVWIQVNQPVRKGVLLEVLDGLRPSVEVEHEHEIQKWKKRR
jgi:hypothetical protein